MPPIFASPDLLRLIAVSAFAAVLVIVHLRLAFRAFRRESRGRGVVACVVPGAGAAMAWRRGERMSPVVYGLLAVAYLLVRYLPGGG